MTGFIRGLFNRNKDGDAPKAKKDDNSFFLDPDDAKTFGDIDYMRTPKTIKRTFPKTLSNKSEAPRIETVSAMESVRSKQPLSSMPDYIVNTPAEPTPEAPTVDRSETNQRRNTDTNLDMFRDMARGMKKG